MRLNKNSASGWSYNNHWIKVLGLGGFLLEVWGWLGWLCWLVGFYISSNICWVVGLVGVVVCLWTMYLFSKRVYVFWKKRAPGGCLGVYRGDDTTQLYWELFHKPRNKDPVIKQPVFFMESTPWKINGWNVLKSPIYIERKRRI